MVALVGENGAGKSTVLQAAASVYKQPPEANKKLRFASYYFPETTWEKIPSATIKWWAREGAMSSPVEGSVRKFPGKWRGNPDRRERFVENIDLSRIQPVSARVGFMRLAKATLKEAASVRFNEEKLTSLSAIMGRPYELTSMASTELDKTRFIPVIAHGGDQYSGFHSGAGETTMIEFLSNEVPKYSLASSTK